MMRNTCKWTLHLTNKYGINNVIKTKVHVSALGPKDHIDMYEYQCYVEKKDFDIQIVEVHKPASKKYNKYVLGINHPTTCIKYKEKVMLVTKDQFDDFKHDETYTEVFLLLTLQELIVRKHNLTKYGPNKGHIKAYVYTLIKFLSIVKIAKQKDMW